MTSSVQTNISDTNILRNYIRTHGGVVSGVSPAQPETSEDKFVKQENQKSDESQNVANQPKEEVKKSHRKRKLAIAVASSALLVGGGMTLLMRGLPKNTEKYLENLKKYLEQKLEKSTSKGSERLSEFLEVSIRKVDSTIAKTQSINNFSSLKDVLFKNLMDRNKYTARIHKGISDYYEKLARNTVFKAYNKSTSRFSKMAEEFDKLDEKILAHNPDELITYNGKTYKKRELVELAKQYREKVKFAVDNFTSNSELQSRYDYIKDATKELYSKFWDESFKDFYTKENKFKNNKFRRKEMWQTCIYDEKIKGNKKSLSEDVSKVRNLISYTDKDRTKLMSNQIKTLKNLLSPSDKDGLAIIKKLEWFTNNPEGLAANRESMLRELNAIKERPLIEGLSEAAAEKHIKAKETTIQAIADLLDNNETGQLQKMLGIYKKIAPYELEKSKAETSISKAVSSFDKALETETVDFFDKVRDLQMGSAPTDVLTILASAGMIAYGLEDASDKDEKISVLLTAGIPILGTIGTSFICTTKLISGGLSLLFGTAMGGVFKVVCDGLDAHRLSRKQKNPTNGEVA